jgi:hypothetical protein
MDKVCPGTSGFPFHNAPQLNFIHWEDIQELHVIWKNTIVLYFKVYTWQTFASSEGQKSIKIL